MKTNLLMAVYASAMLLMAGCGGNNNVPTECSDIKDTATNLFIYDNSSPDIPSWQDADNACNALSVNNCGDWRLPTLAEMQAIYDNNTFTISLAHWTYEYWASDIGSTGAGYHGCFDVNGGLILDCADNAPISYSCVHE